jgi:hypothetical protein
MTQSREDVLVAVRVTPRTQEILQDAVDARVTIGYEDLGEYVRDAMRRLNRELIEATNAERGDRTGVSSPTR